MEWFVKVRPGLSASLFFPRWANAAPKGSMYGESLLLSSSSSSSSSSITYRTTENISTKLIKTSNALVSPAFYTLAP